MAKTKYLFFYECKRGMEEEYVRRHEAVWPEVIAALREAGFSNFITFMKDNRLYATIESEDAFAPAWARFQANPDTVRWEAYMSDVLVTDVTTGGMEVLDRIVFHME
ncbi:L-rhamnose mutarotase [Paenibacillus sp. CF384]|uniref:L-rhamnose mutarotase n=1 Tax=Paenibacillus sp. CF384 TaxID=1884382 RepID=UPI0008948C6C|nr:L-rhamnose mutarotase [Paenibacillus sp. CF384]SDY01148.1 L-rhamnose mutarotase [Paenibacillus sp. CF384]